ncbi:MAG: arginase family protein [Butyrivibrio sp.]|uniref:arginase family protein n=1 Tax=Butyrivibrio sp. TaxID=28121 RepID=UPI0025BFBEE2|nr:arginase family protein [Butyrivibrio sp.]MBQ6589909.1 arginase family protein [Butyrivibrio sp.]
MKNRVSVFNFSGIYDNESFYREDKSSICVEAINCREIPGTNCMCDDAAMDMIRDRIREAGIGPDEIHFIDNGNYHYMSAIMLEQVKEPCSLVVFDHHSDMQPPMFGDILSCGGWVLYVLEHSSFIRDVHIIGADRKLIDELPEDVRSKATFYDVSDVVPGMDDNDGNFEIVLPKTQYPVYLSIDKDVIVDSELTTNWDQGEMRITELLAVVHKLFSERDVIGVDICGECAPEQEGIDIGAATEDNDSFNGELLKAICAKIK